MQLTDAISLIETTDYRQNQATQWADLGCGKGLFTKALASFQKPGSVIYAVDTDRSALQSISRENSVRIEPVWLDFIQDDWPFQNLDGILMANSLHYVNDKKGFLQKAIQHLTDSGSFLIVEYDTEKANPWVPYPIGFRSLGQLFHSLGFGSIKKVGERPSLYGQAHMYASYISR
ncbi:class I SAM-dependent methyltransferase [Spirosoma sp. SC4-14]|uniref:class I SAM-dependent methyltransferase n=1 Tax=Spirosoma sp. SC4-14 TaxID=3128900 RepID=UPI0030CCA193